MPTKVAQTIILTKNLKNMKQIILTTIEAQIP